MRPSCSFSSYLCVFPSCSICLFLCCCCSSFSMFPDKMGDEMEVDIVNDEDETSICNDLESLTSLYSLDFGSSCLLAGGRRLIVE